MNDLHLVSDLEGFKNLANNPYRMHEYFTDWDGNIYPVPETDKGIVNFLIEAAEEEKPIFYAINWIDEKLFTEDGIQIPAAYLRD